MSIRVMSRVWDSGIADKSELLVMLALADFSNDAGECWPAVKSIAKKARLSERSVQRICRALEDRGALTICTSSARAGCNMYRLTPDTASPPDTVSPPDTRVTPPLTPVSPEPSLNRQVEPYGSTRRAKEDQIRVHLETVLSPDVADDFMAHRKAIRKPLTERAAQLIAKQLADHFDPDAVVCASIRNGWTGVFPDSVKAPGGNHGNGTGNGHATRSGNRPDPAIEQIARLAGLGRA